VKQETYSISYDEAPRSSNAGGAGARRHWSAAHKEKMRWEGIYGMLLLEKRVPRGMTSCKIDVKLEFKHRNRRDVENYRPAVAKPFADTLVKGGWLPDDTDDYFTIDGMEIIKRALEHPSPSVMGRITIVLEATYADGDA
jgi:hypothetical protein